MGAATQYPVWIHFDCSGREAIFKTTFTYLHKGFLQKSHGLPETRKNTGLSGVETVGQGGGSRGRKAVLN